MRCAVPLGASALLGWCSSTISTESKYRAASLANRIMSTAPIPKLGATTTPTPDASASHPRISSRRDASRPVVPTTTLTPCSTHQRTLSMTASGWVKSTATVAPEIDVMSSSRSTVAARVSPSAASTALHTSDPIRPRAPSTATAIGAEALMRLRR